MTSTTCQMSFETVNLENNIVYNFLSELEQFNHVVHFLRDWRRALKHGVHKPGVFNSNTHFRSSIYTTIRLCALPMRELDRA